MAQIANIAVSDDLVAKDKTLTAVQPGASGNPARWVRSDIGDSKVEKPELTYSVKRSVNGRAYRARVKFVWPYVVTDTVTGMKTVVETAIADMAFTVPRNMPDALVTKWLNNLSYVLATNTSLGGSILNGEDAR